MTIVVGPCMRRACGSARTWIALLGLIAAVALSPSARAAGGAAGAVLEARAVAGVERVVMRAVGELIVRQGETESLQVEAEPALLPKIASEVRDGTLYLAFRATPIWTTAPLRFHLTVRQIESLESVASANVRIGALRAESFLLTLSGSGNVDIESLDARRFETRLTGSGNVRIGAGRVGRQRVLLQGSGNYLAGAMASHSATLSIEGSGNAMVHAGEELVVRIAGSGNVRYHGNPLVEHIVTGSGGVSRVGGW